MSRLQIISDRNKKSLNIKILLNKKINNHKFKKDNLIIVIGGDGFMLETLKKYKNYNKFFYGINSGNYGFLMNKFTPKNLIKNLSNSRMISISPLVMTVKSNSKVNKKFLAIIFNIFKLLEDETNEEHKKYLMEGLLSIMIPTNNKIKNWIRENLTC